MHPLERRGRILELLETENFITVERVQEELGISPATTRRDFGILADEMRVVRGRGGVHRLETAPVMGLLPFTRQKIARPDLKDKIARAAVSLIPANSVIIVDGGTTTAYLARHLTGSTRVITNSVNLTGALMQVSEDKNYRLEVTMTGGYLQAKGDQLLGPQAISSLRDFHAEWALLGASGIASGGIFNSSTLAAETQREMIERAQKVAFLIDSSKFEHTDMVRVCALDVLDVLVTDAKPAGALATALMDAKVDVVIA